MSASATITKKSASDTCVQKSCHIPSTDGTPSGAMVVEEATLESLVVHVFEVDACIISTDTAIRVEVHEIVPDQAHNASREIAARAIEVGAGLGERIVVFSHLLTDGVVQLAEVGPTICLHSRLPLSACEHPSREFHCLQRHQLRRERRCCAAGQHNS